MSIEIEKLELEISHLESAKRLMNNSDPITVSKIEDRIKEKQDLLHRLMMNEGSIQIAQANLPPEAMYYISYLERQNAHS